MNFLNYYIDGVEYGIHLSYWILEHFLNDVLL